MTALAELVALLEARIGLDAESIGTSAIERAVRQRLAACHLADDRAYLNHVRSSETELQELVECIVVPETWFFRDREALAALGRLAAIEAHARGPDAMLRLLSLPCSTGEEPYSMAMALFDAGLGAERFQVHAVDISARALAVAQRAIYGRNSFRGSDLEYRARYFESVPNGYQLAQRVRRCVEFRQDNLLDLELSRPVGGYDFIFCRNVLIYFALPAQRHALRTLHDLLAPAGLVFVGPSETSLMLRHEYVSAKMPLAFAFRKTADGGDVSPPRAPSASPRLPAPSAPLSSMPSLSAPPSQTQTGHRSPSRRAVAPAAPREITPTPPTIAAAARELGATPHETAPTPRATVADVERLADQGRLDEAAEACENLLRDGAADAGVYYLAGVVYGALGHHAKAIELYRKALYLDPLHADALAHLAYLLDTQGDTARADVLRDRARRARERQQL